MVPRKMNAVEEKELEPVDQQIILTVSFLVILWFQVLGTMLTIARYLRLENSVKEVITD